MSWYDFTFSFIFTAIAKQSLLNKWQKKNSEKGTEAWTFLIALRQRINLDGKKVGLY